MGAEFPSGGGGGAPLNSPAFTGVPTAPTPAAGTNTTQLATTAYVVAALLAGALVLDIRRYGAVIDGATDDATAVQAALSAAAVAGFGTVLHTGGTCVIGTGLTIDKGVRLAGVGEGSIWKVKNAANITLLSLVSANSSNTTLANFKIDGNKANQTTGAGIAFDYSGNTFGHSDKATIIENVSIDNVKNDAILLKNTTNGQSARLNNVQVYWCDGIGFNIQMSDSQFVNCATEKTGLQGWQIGPTAGNSHLVNCIGADSGQITAAVGYGFKISSAATLAGCFSQSNSAHGYYMNGSGNTLVGCTADSNSFANAAGGFAGFYVETATSNNYMIGCNSYDRFAGGSRTQKYGFQVVGSATNVVIQGASHNNVTAESLNTSSGAVTIDLSGATTAGLATEITRATAAEALLAPLASPALTGNPTVPTQVALTNSTRAASTAYTDAAVAVEASRATGVEAAKAPLASPALTGSPTAPTQTALDNTTKVSTTAYADLAVGVEKTRALAAEALLAPLASPALTGNPTVPTQAALTNNTRAASTAYTDAAVTAGLALGAAPTGSASGWLAGSYPSPTIARSSIWQPSDNNLIAANYDPALTTTAGGTDGTGTYHLSRIQLPVAATIANICFLVAAAAVTLTSNRNVVGIYDSSGVLIAYSADQTWASTGFIQVSLANVVGGKTISPLPAGTYYAMFQSGATTQPTLARRTSLAVGAVFAGNANIAAANLFRSGTQTGNAALAIPAAVTIASVSANTKDFWMGLS